jgi:hypothetical protein
MLGALAAIVLVVGGISTTAVLTEDQRLAHGANPEPIVEVQAIESLDKVETESNF